MSKEAPVVPSWTFPSPPPPPGESPTLTGRNPDFNRAARMIYLTMMEVRDQRYSPSDAENEAIASLLAGASRSTQQALLTGALGAASLLVIARRTASRPPPFFVGVLGVIMGAGAGAYAGGLAVLPHLVRDMAALPYTIGAETRAWAQSLGVHLQIDSNTNPEQADRFSRIPRVRAAAWAQRMMEEERLRRIGDPDQLAAFMAWREAAKIDQVEERNDAEGLTVQRWRKGVEKELESPASSSPSPPHVGERDGNNGVGRGRRVWGDKEDSTKSTPIPMGEQEEYWWDPSHFVGYGNHERDASPQDGPWNDAVWSEDVGAERGDPPPSRGHEERRVPRRARQQWHH